MPQEIVQESLIEMCKIFGEIFIDRLLNSVQCFRTFCDLTQFIVDLGMLSPIPKRRSPGSVVIGHIVIPVYSFKSPVNNRCLTEGIKSPKSRREKL